ncbi:hypothetical protein Q8F55_005681 [Vanrija albida]|uniref:PinX1-related protein 1 n=1 Tax=Vanrija albida TaxID=181172 RepID=A0ABR3Q2L8_9TREE
MGLAERKVKQRIGYDPRNLTWSNDKDRFSFKHMTALGWDDSKGIGKDQQGNRNHIAVAQKLDNSGIGMGRARKEGEDLSAGAGQAGAGLADVLARLAAAKSASASANPSPAPSHEASPAPESSPGPSAVRNKIASRQKHLRSKRMATSNATALAEILGVPASSLPASPAASTPASAPESPAESGASTPTEDSDARTSYETISTSTVSVSDYFRQKLREKALARQAASGSATPLPSMPEGSLAVVKDEVKVAVGGVAWEGSKMAFAEVTEEVVLGDLGADAPAIPSEKKEKKSKGKGKSKSEGASPSTPDEASDDAAAAPSDKEEKRRRKEEKRARKEEKAAKKAAKAEKRASGSDDAAAGDKKKRKRDEGEDGERKRKSRS